MKRTFSSEDLVRACEQLGWTKDRHRGGSHMVFVKDGEPRPIIIQQGHDVIAGFIVSNVCRQLGVSKKELRQLLAKK